MLIKVDRSRVVLFCEIAQMDKRAGALMMTALERRGGSRGDEDLRDSLQVVSARTQK